MDIGGQYLEGDRSPNRDKDENDPLSYNSRPFYMQTSLKGVSDNRYGMESQSNYSGL